MSENITYKTLSREDIRTGRQGKHFLGIWAQGTLEITPRMPC